ncbi:50S ribosomal protein L30e-like [Vigna unguiculata]|uniref:50S ribosomal protein L30e-like n=1 Tax=Vigna unguiculata TaxID=3917 RepID=A0A4D6N5B6_VIGUN|nr:50S ribosomal protein L30e-like [Vigna unguiculata]
MASRSNFKTPKKDGNTSNSSFPSLENNYEGERLTNLLQSIRREIRTARDSDGTSLSEKIWLKQQFSIGVNDVTRVLERMKPCTELESSAQLVPLRSNNNKTPSVKLQAVLVASDCNPRWLTKHLQSLASSRSVPLIFVGDNKHGSFRLGLYKKS